jgi:hypothetical protein
MYKTVLARRQKQRASWHTYAILFFNFELMDLVHIYFLYSSSIIQKSTYIYIYIYDINFILDSKKYVKVVPYIFKNNCKSLGMAVD